MKTDKQKFIARKIKLIMKEGVRGSKVKLNQATAIAYAMYKRIKKD